METDLLQSSPHPVVTGSLARYRFSKHHRHGFAGWGMVLVLDIDPQTRIDAKQFLRVVPVRDYFVANDVTVTVDKSPKYAVVGALTTIDPSKLELSGAVVVAGELAAVRAGLAEHILGLDRTARPFFEGGVLEVLSRKKPGARLYGFLTSPGQPGPKVVQRVLGMPLDPSTGYDFRLRSFTLDALEGCKRVAELDWDTLNDLKIATVRDLGLPLPQYFAGHVQPRA